jgi:hypothetical protein
MKFKRAFKSIKMTVLPLSSNNLILQSQNALIEESGINKKWTKLFYYNF